MEKKASSVSKSFLPSFGRTVTKVAFFAESEKTPHCCCLPGGHGKLYKVPWGAIAPYVGLGLQTSKKLTGALTWLKKGIAELEHDYSVLSLF